jgi:hypothetical protein
MAIYSDYYAKNFDLCYEHLGEKGSHSEFGPGWASMTLFTNFRVWQQREASAYHSSSATRRRFPPVSAPRPSPTSPTLLEFAEVNASGKEAAVLAGRSRSPCARPADRVHAPD